MTLRERRSHPYFRPPLYLSFALRFAPSQRVHLHLHSIHAAAIFFRRRFACHTRAALRDDGVWQFAELVAQWDARGAELF